MFSISKSTKQTHHKKEYPQGHWAIEKALNITNHLKNVDERIPGPPPQERLKWPALAMVSGGTDEEKLEVSNMASARAHGHNHFENLWAVGPNAKSMCVLWPKNASLKCKPNKY